MNGTGIIAITTALIEIGMIPPTEPETIVVFDTPAGLVESYARVQGNQVYEVSVANVSSFLYARDVEINLPDLGKVIIDVSFGGNFFAVAQARSLGISFHADNITKLTEWGIMLKKAVNEKLQVQHPIQKHITTVELTAIYDRPEPARPFVNSIVVFGNGQVDRSPCGTGTSAIMATLYGKGELKLGVEFTSESLIGTSFRGKLLREVKVGNLTTVDPMFTGEAYITGIQQFVLDPNDPVKYGFVLG